MLPVAMERTRRDVLASLVVGVTAGCVGTGGDGGAPSATRSPDAGPGSPSPDGGGATPTPAGCDPADVTRPPIVEDANHPPTGYGTKPMELTAQAVADYLADFETAYAWNRLLVEHGDLATLSVDTTTPWVPESVGPGYLASSRLEVAYGTSPDVEPVSRDYVASYYVSAGPVYRVETEDEAVDPRTHPERQLVQCGTDTK